MAKLCKYTDKKDLSDKKDFEKYVELVKGGKYVCTRCGRVAKDKDNLCKPEKIED